MSGSFEPPRRKTLARLVFDVGRTKLLNLVEDVFINETIVPESVAKHPAMLGPGDRSLYYFAAKRFYKFKGHIVDAGVFLGGTTKALLQGVRDNSKYDPKLFKKITVYDRFIVETEDYTNFIQAHTGQKIVPGQSFRSAFDSLFGSDADAIDMQAGDFLEKTCNLDFIEVLGLDICKNKQLTIHSAIQFFPRLKQYESIVMHQDYAHIWQPWIPVSMEALSDYFDKSAQIDSCALFHCIKSIGRDEVTEIIEEAFQPAKAVALMSRAVAKAHTSRSHFIIGLSEAKLRADLFGRDEGLDFLETVKMEGRTGAQLKPGTRLATMYGRMKDYIAQCDA